jgi:hypothetical protein
MVSGVLARKSKKERLKPAARADNACHVVGTRFVCERASETLVGEALRPRAQDVSRSSMSSKWRPNGGMKLVIGNLRIAARVCL